MDYRTLAWLVAVAYLSSLYATGCADDSSTPPTADTGILDARTSGITPARECNAYLDCLSAAEPQAFAATLTLYQSDGPCWQNDDAAAKCRSACQQAHDQLKAAYPKISECRGCDPRQSLGCAEAGKLCNVNGDCGDSCQPFRQLKLGDTSLEFLSRGFCVLRCSGNAPCPQGATCLETFRVKVPVSELFEVSVALPEATCLESCRVGQSDCTSGSVCFKRLDDTSGAGVCLPQQLLGPFQ